MTECKHAVPGSEEHINYLLTKIDDLYNDLDECAFNARKIKEQLLDRHNRRAIIEVEHHIETAMDILEDIK